MTYANEAIPEVETPYYVVCVQALLQGNMHVQCDGYVPYSLIVIPQNTPLCKIQVTILIMQMRITPVMERLGYPSTAK